MAAERDYIRGSNGRFAGASASGTKVTRGRAGGFANAAFRARVAATRKAGGTGAKGHSGRRAKFLAKPTAIKVTRLVAAGAAGVTVGSFVGRSAGLPVTGAALGAYTAVRVASGQGVRTRSAARPRNPSGRKIKR